MSNTASKVIATARAETGYLEKASNAQLDDKTANAGSGNYTKYARDLDELGFFNGKKNGHPWCAVFAAWLFVQTFGVDIARELLCQPEKSLGAGCGWAAKYFQNKGQFHTADPQPGDLIFFKSGTTVSHMGLVVDVDDAYVYTVEGNTSGGSQVIANGGGVCEKKYALNHAQIHGYGRPAYDPEEVKVPELRTLQRGDTGEDVRALQILLSGRGYNGKMTTPDGKFGPNTQGAVKLYQQAKGLTVDGVAGADTWSGLLGLEGTA